MAKEPPAEGSPEGVISRPGLAAHPEGGWFSEIHRSGAPVGTPPGYPGHRGLIERRGDVLLFNPGYGGKQRFHLPRSVGILRCDEQGISASHLAL